MMHIDKEDYRPSPMPAKSPFEQMKKNSYQRKHNDGKSLIVKGKKKETPLSEFDNTRDTYWNKVTNDWLKEKDAQMIDDDIKVLNKDKSVWAKLLYWVIFKVVYHVTFVYWYLKGLILRRW